jgi:hypothetical protein
LQTTPNPIAAHAVPKGMNRRWLYGIVILALLFVLMPFLFWQSTWFGRPLTDEQIEKNLSDQAHPRKAQHALSQIADRLASRDPAVHGSVRRWYPHVIALSTQSVDELRLTAAWVMGQDNTVPEFHQALLRLLADAHPMVQRNAALSLVRFGDTTGLPVIRAMLDPYGVPAPHAGTLKQRLKGGEGVNPGTLLGRIEEGGQTVEVRSQVPGTLERWLAHDGATVSTGQPVVSLAPSAEMALEALRALYLIGQPGDLPTVERYARGNTGMPERVRQQADLVARAIRARATSPSS